MAQECSCERGYYCHHVIPTVGINFFWPWTQCIKWALWNFCVALEAKTSTKTSTVQQLQTNCLQACIDDWDTRGMSHFSHPVPICSLMANKKLSQMVTNRAALSDANTVSLGGNSKWHNLLFTTLSLYLRTHQGDFIKQKKAQGCFSNLFKSSVLQPWFCVSSFSYPSCQMIINIVLTKFIF